jgi:hypothetical protein
MSGPLERPATRPRRLGSPRIAVLATLMGAAAVAACTLGAPTGDQTPIGDSTAPPVPDSPVEGVIVEVTSTGLGQVERFTLRLADGTRIVLHMGVLENPAEFPPGHLAEHQATSEPIRAYFRDEDEGPTVYRIEDAAEPPSS